ncbi:hypothetical protein OIV83_005283 [Microbotryomycetes sp. JL201]|nr:hypothetical protein OIV83_005283 [Microbotryomycetes sp. JL201]
MEADLAQPPPPRSKGASGNSKEPSKPKFNRKRTLSTTERDNERSRRQHRQWDKYGSDLRYDWSDENDIQAFAKALAEEPTDLLGEATQTQKIRAVSDFAPIKERRRRDIVREGWAYHVSRWPLLAIIFTVIFLEFVTYVIVRQLVNLIEYFSAWRGHRGKLRMALRNAKTYQEWRSCALALDDYLRFNEWKKSAPNAYYDSPLVRRVLRTLRQLREDEDVEGVCAVLHAALRSNFAGVENFRLYSETFFGTKELIEDYVEEVARCISFVRQAPASTISLEEKQEFFRSAAKNLGASALCLSGGACFGWYHLGVCRAMLDEGLLPRVITGTSAGALVAAFICCRTDSELRQLLKPELADRITACEESTFNWLRRFWRTGARFDTVDWARKASFFTLGNMTFREAYERTGRILNVSVIPYDTHSPTKLLNYLTAPDCVIYTAVIASAAVPGILNPVVLLTKNKDGSVSPWEFQGKHKDGSLRVDIPLHSLHLLYNVNFSIVSQVNPHIHLFHFAPRGAPGRPVAHRKGKGWRGGFFLSAAEQLLKLELTKNFRVIRDLELMPEFAGQNWSSVWLQKFEGSVTIWPKSRIKDWSRILTDPDREELERMIWVGQRVTWPKLKMIENRFKIERQVDLGREEVMRQLSAEDPHLAHRTSSFDLLHGSDKNKNDSSRHADGSGSSSDSSSSDSGSDATVSNKPSPARSPLPPSGPTRQQSNGSTSSTSTTNSASQSRRRKAILARLGLKQALSSAAASFEPNGMNGSQEHAGSQGLGLQLSGSEDSDIGIGQSTKAGEEQLRRRRRKGLVKNLRQDVNVPSSEDEGGR